jgi:protocatechuate 3,4-dioxygenase beta subunit
MTQISRRFLATLALLSAAATLFAQTPARDRAPQFPVGSGLIAGVVVTDGASPRPVRRASVTLTHQDTGLSRAVITDDAGRFQFVDMGPGRYMLSATRAGFMTIAYGATRPGGTGTALTLGDGQRLADVRLVLLRGAVITGTVRDERGEPMPGMRVSVMAYRYSPQTGERTLSQMTRALGVETDDRGQYRAYGLPPEDYLVLASFGISPRGLPSAHQMTSQDVQWALRQLQTGSASGPTTAAGALPPRSPMAYAPVFYPGAMVPSAAATITVKAGEERSGIDINMIRIPTANLEGTVTMPDGSVPPATSIALVAQERVEGLPFSGFSSATAQKGTFSFTGLTPGVYTVTARIAASPGRGTGPLPAGSASLYAMEDVTIAGTDATVSLTLRPGVTVSGRIVFDGTTLKPPATLTSMRVNLAPLRTGGVTLGVAAAMVAADGTFEFTGVTPGRYRIEASAPGSTPARGWQLRRATVGGQDSLDDPVEIGGADVAEAMLVFTDRPAELSGRVQDATGQAAPEYFIIAFAADERWWLPQSRRIRSARPGSDGRFSFPNLAPGDYFIAAVTDVEAGQWFDPAFLREIMPASVKLTIGEGEQKVQDFRVGGR